MRGPSFGAGCAGLIGRRMARLSSCCCNGPAAAGTRRIGTNRAISQRGIAGFTSFGQPRRMTSRSAVDARSRKLHTFGHQVMPSNVARPRWAQVRVARQQRGVDRAGGQPRRFAARTCIRRTAARARHRLVGACRRARTRLRARGRTPIASPGLTTQPVRTSSGISGGVTTCSGNMPMSDVTTGRPMACACATTRPSTGGFDRRHDHDIGGCEGRRHVAAVAGQAEQRLHAVRLRLLEDGAGIFAVACDSRRRARRRTRRTPLSSSVRAVVGQHDLPVPRGDPAGRQHDALVRSICQALQQRLRSARAPPPPDRRWRCRCCAG